MPRLVVIKGLSVTLIGLGLFLGGCGSGDDGAGDTKSATSRTIEEGNGPSADPPTGCPVDAATVARIVGRELPQEPMTQGVIGGGCRFSDGQSTVEITVQGAESGAALFDTNKQMTAQEFGDPVKDLQRGKRGYVAVNPSGDEIIAARAVVVNDKASYTVNLSGFVGYDRAKYEEAAVGLIDAMVT